MFERDMSILSKLADLLRERDRLDGDIAQLIGMSARDGDVGEFIAKVIFDINLAPARNNKGHDGTFVSGALKGCTVNVKRYSSTGTNGIDLPEETADAPGEHHCAYYLVLDGREGGASNISKIYLFEAAQLLPILRGRTWGGKPIHIGTATSIRDEDRDDAEIYPKDSPRFRLTPAQRNALSLFGPQP